MSTSLPIYSEHDNRQTALTQLSIRYESFQSQGSRLKPLKGIDTFFLTAAGAYYPGSCLQVHFNHLPIKV